MSSSWYRSCRHNKLLSYTIVILKILITIQREAMFGILENNKTWAVDITQRTHVTSNIYILHTSTILRVMGNSIVTLKCNANDQSLIIMLYTIYTDIVLIGFTCIRLIHINLHTVNYINRFYLIYHFKKNCHMWHFASLLQTILKFDMMTICIF